MAESATDSKTIKIDVNDQDDSSLKEEGSEKHGVKDQLDFSNPNVDIIKRSEIPLDGIEIMNSTKRKDTPVNKEQFNIRKDNDDDALTSLENVSDIRKLNKSNILKKRTNSIESADVVSPDQHNSNSQSKQWRTTKPLYQGTRLSSSHEENSMVKDKTPESKVNIHNS